ncbi:MAG: hypothetical protein ABSF90_27795, partial [Syntrophobacteraceae bacterium]
ECASALKTEEKEENARLIFDRQAGRLSHRRFWQTFSPAVIPRHESTAQRLFFAVAYSYCVANNVDISPEVDTGTGQIDFKCAKGFDSKVLVEIKLSTNPRILHGYETQLEIYKKSEDTLRAFYVVIDVGRMGDKDQKLVRIKNEAAKKGQPLSELVFIDGILKPSASKRR